MSNSGGDPTANLLASLKAHTSRGSPAPDPSFSFTLPAASPSSGQAFKSPSSTTHAPQNMSRQTTPASQGPPNLLGLLKFGQPSPSPHNPSQTNVGTLQPTSHQDGPQATPTKTNPVTSTSPSLHAKGISASDLVSNIMGNKPSPQVKQERATKTSLAHQDSLLKMLNKTARSSESPQTRHETPSPKSRPQEIHFASFGDNQAGGRQESPMRLFGDKENKPSTPFEPFEFKAGSSPNQLPRQTSPHIGTAKRGKSQSPAVQSTSSRRKLTPAGDDVLQSIENSGPESRRDGRTPVEALMGIGAPSRDAETVAQALNEVGSQVDRQVESALAKAEESERSAIIKQEKDDDLEAAKFDAIEEHVHDAAVGLKQELDKPENKNALKEKMPSLAAADAVKDIIDEAAEGKGEEEEATHGQLARQIKVYQFPMRPFVLIDLAPKDLSDLVLREESSVPIARFKKEFDQSDRTLATATNDFIAYAVPKNSGGIRVIEQDSGKSSLLFGDSQDRIFNIAISTEATAQPQGHGPQKAIATGVSGAVYWATIGEPGTELSQEDMQQTSVIFPPTSAGTDVASGGQLKTRAKRSSRSPDFFAIGRGKAIQIVFPANARNSTFFNTTNSTLNSEAYFADRSLKIITGKAGKDFTFSEDDTTIVTLDKAGKLRIWDIRELTDPSNGTASKMAPIEVRSPILTFATVQASEKSWPTSVLFVDKLRPYTKGTALRYIIVGMKQNHTLQLWDLCLGKAVQELNFPHEKETDGICSVAYHASSGIIVVGHPTRNSIFFIHLSAPRYNLPGMSQAKFAQRYANKDHSLPKAEATAIMSGMREYTLSDKGQLRSIELTSPLGDPTRPNEEDDDPALFDLYVMHSKGVHCLSIRKEDLGWSDDSRVQNPVDAEAEGIIMVKELKEFSSSNTSDHASLSANADEPAFTAPSPKPSVKASSNENGKSNRIESIPSSGRDVDQKKGKKGGASAETSKSTPNSVAQTPSAKTAQTAAVTSQSQPNANAQKDASRPGLSKYASRDAPEATSGSVEERAKTAIANGDTVSVGISGEFLDKELKKIEVGVSNEFNKVLKRELDSLYKQIAEDRRVQDVSGVSKQDALLRLISSTLSDNVEKSLSRIIQKSIQDSVVPSLGELVKTAMTKQVNTIITEQIKSVVPPAVKHAVEDAMKRPDMFRAISEHVSKAVSAHVDREFSNAMTKTIAPGFHTAASNVATTISSESERRTRDQIAQLDAQRQSDSIKIDQLTALITGMSGMLNTMAEAQSQFQSKILELQQQVPHSLTPSESASYHPSPEQEELRNITKLWNSGDPEEATVTWLSSQQQIMLFDEFFVHINPNYLRDLSPLMVLSIGACVTTSMSTNIHERLIWLDAALKATNPKAEETREVGGRILDVLTQRLEGEYMRIAEADPKHSALRTIATLTKQARNVRSLFP